MIEQAGGFDKLTLDSLYDDALQKRGPNGAVPNSYNMGMNTAAPNPFQGPGMPPQQHMDPFMASGQYAPPSNVQLAMMQQQQQALMMQQQQQQMNPFGNPYAAPAGGQYPYGAPQPAPVPGQLALPAPPPAYQNPFGNPGLL